MYLNRNSYEYFLSCVTFCTKDTLLMSMVIGTVDMWAANLHDFKILVIIVD